MSADRDATWYVKASFGAEWGPMTAATLLEMDERGSLGSGDMVRCGVDGDWRSVTEVLQELAVASTSTVSDVEINDNSAIPDSDSESFGEPVAEESITVAEVPAMGIAKPRRSGALPGWSNFWTGSTADQPSESLPQLTGIEHWSQAASEDSSDPQDEELMTAEVIAVESATDAAPITPPRVEFSMHAEPVISPPAAITQPPSELAAPGSEMDLLNRWKQERADELIRLKAIVAEREAAIARAAEAAKAAEAQAAIKTSGEECTLPETTAETTSAPITPPRMVSPAKLPVATTRPTKANQQESWEQILTRWKRSLPDWRFAILLLLLPAVAWRLWPVSFGDVAGIYHSIYNELREIRDRPQDKSGMAEFVERSQAKLDKLIPRLNENANSKDPDTQLLLWIGRDCLRPMLKNPRARNTKQEAMLKKLLAQWDQTHNVPVTEEPPESMNAKSEDSALPAPPAGSKPLGFGRSSEPTEPAEAELPESKPPSKAKPTQSDGEDPN